MLYSVLFYSSHNKFLLYSSAKKTDTMWVLIKAPITRSKKKLNNNKSIIMCNINAKIKKEEQKKTKVSLTKHWKIFALFF